VTRVADIQEHRGRDDDGDDLDGDHRNRDRRGNGQRLDESVHHQPVGPEASSNRGRDAETPDLLIQEVVGKRAERRRAAVLRVRAFRYGAR
jgi:hypothetical protein